jgi:mRNA interferase MazF
MQRGEIWWADLGPIRDSAPAKRRPVLVVQADPFNASQIQTVMAAVITSNLKLAEAPGNVSLSKRISKLSRRSVVNVSQVVTLDKQALTERISSLSRSTMDAVDAGLRLALDL